jgi:alpha-galactosidase
VDYVKYDNCYPAAESNQQQDYQRMQEALARTGRNIVFSICAWEFQPWMPTTGNLWRTGPDIQKTWASVMNNYDINQQLAPYARPGAWNDPDMLQIGTGGITTKESRTHMSLWAIMAAPLLAGNDLQSMSETTRSILTAPEVIAVNQDPLGKQGVKVRDDGDQEILTKQLQGTNVRAVALLNRGEQAADIAVRWEEIGLPGGSATVRDLWARSDQGTFTNGYTVRVPSHGTVMLKIASTSDGAILIPSTTPTPAAGNVTSYEAKAGTRSGAAVIAGCPACSGGQKVGFLGYGASNAVNLTVHTPTAGARTVTLF